MFPLTKQERLVVVFILAVLLAGFVLEYLTKTSAAWGKFQEFVATNALYPKVSVNKAGYEDFMAVPGIGAKTAQRILDYRIEKGRISDLDEIRTIPGILEKNFQRMSPYLKL